MIHTKQFKASTLFAFALLYGSISFSQDCKNLILNKKDEFTGELTKVSKTKISKSGGYEEAHFQIDRSGDSLHLTFIYANTNMGAADAGMFSCEKGDKIYLLLEDSSVLKLELKGQYYASRNESAGVAEEVLFGRLASFSKANKIIFEPEFQLDFGKLNLLIEKKIKKIRVESRGQKGYTGKKIKNIEMEIGDKESEQFKKDARCILK